MQIVQIYQIETNIDCDGGNVTRGYEVAAFSVDKAIEAALKDAILRDSAKANYPEVTITVRINRTEQNHVTLAI
jgi:hypothetical protein